MYQRLTAGPDISWCSVTELHLQTQRTTFKARPLLLRHEEASGSTEATFPWARGTTGATHSSVSCLSTQATHAVFRYQHIPTSKVNFSSVKVAEMASLLRSRAHGRHTARPVRGMSAETSNPDTYRTSSTRKESYITFTYKTVIRKISELHI